MIDFGLSSVIDLPEHKGVDLYVLERALLSAHINAGVMFEGSYIADKLGYNEPGIMAAYTTTYGKGVQRVVAKLNDVRARGRKRGMIG